MMRKLTLWDSLTFRPITNHDELEPLMASVGFIPFRTIRPNKERRPQNPNFHSTGTEPAQTGTESVQTGTGMVQTGTETGLTGTELVWREYAFRDRNLPGLELKRWPRPRLPYPRVDGLHLMTYQAFFVSLEYYLGPFLVSNLFHVRSLPFKLSIDEQFERMIRAMEDKVDQETPGTIFYRANTLDKATKIVCDHFRATIGELSCTQYATVYVRKDERRQIELDERDESEDFVSLVPVNSNICND